MVQTQANIEALNIAFNSGYELRQMKHETLDISIAGNPCWFWLQMIETGFLLLDSLLLQKFFKMNSSLTDFPLVV